MDIILATVLVALLSCIGVFFFGKEGHLLGTHRYIVPFAIGTFLGITFFELVPEALQGSSEFVPFAIVGGFLAFYTLAHFLNTYHHHHHHNDDGDSDDHCEASKASAALLLIGDAVHNFVDGIVIASAFIVNPTVGWVTTLGVAIHEAPQEIAEFGVLRHAGYSQKRALVYNLLSASTIVLGALTTIALASIFSDNLWILIGVAAGNLLYVAMSDLIPGVQASVRTTGRFFSTFAATILGLVMIVSLIFWSHDQFDQEQTLPQQGETR